MVDQFVQYARVEREISSLDADMKREGDATASHPVFALARPTVAQVRRVRAHRPLCMTISRVPPLFCPTGRAGRRSRPRLPGHARRLLPHGAAGPV